MPLRQTKTTYGTVQGIPCGNPTFTVYRGIPYAAPPGGNNRFHPPQPPEPWAGTKICDTFPPISVQASPVAGLPFGDFFKKEFYPHLYECSEDSLYLNIWTPADQPDEKLPVLFWIHGGGFGSGYGHEMEFDGEAFCKEGVVLVTINYRLNHFGFFAHPGLSAQNPHGVSGNNGIHDQIAALKWVQQNIAAFGGDPDNVTIFGQSAGGMSVLSHLLTDMSNNLFAKAIIQSGTFAIIGDLMMSTLKDQEEWGEKACHHAGKTLEDLYNMPISELREFFESAQVHLGPPPKLVMDQHMFTDYPLNMLLDSNIKNIPIIVGSVSGDRDLLHLTGKENFPGIPQKEIAFTGDALLGIIQSQKEKIPAYLYYFDPQIPGHDQYHFVEDGLAYHSAELWYLFGTMDRCWRTFDGRHYDLSKTMIKYWSNFAKTGSPNSEGLPQWNPYTEETPEELYLSDKEIKKRPVKNISAIKKIYQINE